MAFCLVNCQCLWKKTQISTSCSWLYFFFHLEKIFNINLEISKSVKSVGIRSFFGPDFTTFRLNTENYKVNYLVNICIQSKCEEIRTGKSSVFGCLLYSASKRVLTWSLDQKLNKSKAMLQRHEFLTVALWKLFITLYLISQFLPD